MNRIQKACHDIKLLGRLPCKVTSNNRYKLFAGRLVFGLELVNAFVPAEDWIWDGIEVNRLKVLSARTFSDPFPLLPLSLPDGIMRGLLSVGSRA